jgi:hypothetical protein
MVTPAEVCAAESVEPGVRGDGEEAPPLGPCEPLEGADVAPGGRVVGPEEIGSERRVDGWAAATVGLNTSRPARSITSQAAVELPATTADHRATATMTTRARLVMAPSSGVLSHTDVAAAWSIGRPEFGQA